MEVKQKENLLQNLSRINYLYKIDLFKHSLNFYSYRLKGRKALNSKVNYALNKDISTDFVNIDINKFVGYNGALAYEGEAPLLKTAIEIYKNPGINVEESFLYDFSKSKLILLTSTEVLLTVPIKSDPIDNFTFVGLVIS